MGIRDEIDQHTGYITPSATEILDHDIVYTYDYALIVGTVDEIRAKVYELDDATRRQRFTFEKDRCHFYYKNITDKGLGNQDCLDFDLRTKVSSLPPRSSWARIRPKYLWTLPSAAARSSVLLQ
jgi:hypothetical protein